MKLDNSCKITAIAALLTLAASLGQALEPQPPAPTEFEYQRTKSSIINKYLNHLPREWGESVTGVKTRIRGSEKLIALTFDACGSSRGMKFDRELIQFLEQEKVPATLFINARWIEQNRKEFDRLATNSLFEIANHGFSHKPASVTGKSVYGISGTRDAGELLDEIELNARRIAELTGKRPRFYRSGTAYYDEIAVKIAAELQHDVAGFTLLGDAGATYTRHQVKSALLSAKPGDIAILHFNHPESGTASGVMDAIPELKRRGFRFVRLSDVELE